MKHKRRKPAPPPASHGAGEPEAPKGNIVVGTAVGAIAGAGLGWLVGLPVELGVVGFAAGAAWAVTSRSRADKAMRDRHRKSRHS